MKEKNPLAKILDEIDPELSPYEEFGVETRMHLSRGPADNNKILDEIDQMMADLGILDTDNDTLQFDE